MASCCFIGHRVINKTDTLVNLVTDYIKDLIFNKKVETFLFGSRSKFDDLCYDIVTNFKRTHKNIIRIRYTIRSECVTLESDYEKFDEKFRLQFKHELYDGTYEEEREYKDKWVSGKESYIKRNQCMIDDSDYCVFYFDHNYEAPMMAMKKNMLYKRPNSGTKIAFEYAIKSNKKIFNVFENQFFNQAPHQGASSQESPL